MWGTASVHQHCVGGLLLHFYGNDRRRPHRIAATNGTRDTIEGGAQAVTLSNLATSGKAPRTVSVTSPDRSARAAAPTSTSCRRSSQMGIHHDRRIAHRMPSSRHLHNEVTAAV